jgi:pyridoxal 5'-phosphate synthase pdxT subunit
LKSEISNLNFSDLTIGVLAIQGDYDAHRIVLERLGARVRLVRKPEELAGLDAIVIPGGESSTFLNFLRRDELLDDLKRFVGTHAAFGTCAGAILLAKDVQGPAQESLGAIDISVTRNAYGRQINSTIKTADTKLPGGPIEMVYIRAPKITRIGDGVEVLAERDGDPVLVRSADRRVMVATFHPELSQEIDETKKDRIHREFLESVREQKSAHVH